MNGRRSSLRRTGAVGATVVCILVTSGCEWTGLNSLSLPGAEGRESNSFLVEIEMPNVTTLTRNSPVRVDDVTVGSVRDIEVQDWHAKVTVSLNHDVVLPRNATAKIGQTSLLGSNHVELAPPVDMQAEGSLGNGDVIPLERAGVFPTTEQTLSSLSVVLNGGGLGQLQDITRELNTALDGRSGIARDLLPQLNELVTQLDDQREDIVSALEGLDRVSGTFVEQKVVLTDALDQLPDTLGVLVDQRQNITDALVAVGDLSEVTNRVLNSSGENLQSDLRNLAPVLASLADTGNHLTDALSILLTFPFSMKTMDNWLKGDYANLFTNLDFSNVRLDNNLLTGTDLGGSLGGIEGALGTLASGTASQNSDPIQGPLQTPQAPSIPQIPGLPVIPGLPAIPGFTAAPGGAP